MELHLAIVDDLAADRERLRREIRHFFQGRGQEVDIEVFSSSEGFLEKARPERFSIVFLDICMGEMNGIELAKKLREADPRLLIVFLTTSREYAFEAFPVHPFDYLIKPCEPEALQHVLLEALRVLSVSDQTVSVRVARGSVDVPLHTLISAVADGHTVVLRLSGGNTVVSTMSFSEISSLLEPDPRFLLCNRGVLINMDQVLTFSEENAVMKDGGTFPLRTKKRAALKAEFSKYLLSKMEGGRFR